MSLAADRSPSPFATPEESTRGRAHEEPEDGFRTPYQRDRDRVIHSEAFRSLQHKTQVYVVNEGDYYRTRLTHTLEVAQIARSLANYLGANEPLTEAIALAHDLGHPPFGHAGEQELNNKLEGPLGGFEHNLQSLRVVDELEVSYPDFTGLNLTFETREGLARHETPYDEPMRTDEFGSPRPGLEAQIVNLADPIAYVTHDLEDALKAGFLEWEEVGELTSDWLAPAFERAERNSADQPRPRQLHVAGRLLVRGLIGSLLPAVVEESTGRLEQLDPELGSEAVRQHPEPVVALPAALQKQVEVVRTFLHARVYKHPMVNIMVRKGSRILGQLFEHFHGHPHHLPRTLTSSWPEPLPANSDPLARALADWLAAMTDRAVLDLHRLVFQPEERTMPLARAGGFR